MSTVLKPQQVICMTSIIFWVFVSYFPTQYMTVLSAGESSSGIISAILIYIQQLNRSNNDSRYSVEIHLLLLALTLPIPAMAFTFLTRCLKRLFDAADDWIANNNNAQTQIINPITSSNIYIVAENNIADIDQNQIPEPEKPQKMRTRSNVRRMTKTKSVIKKVTAKRGPKRFRIEMKIQISHNKKLNLLTDYNGVNGIIRYIGDISDNRICGIGILDDNILGDCDGTYSVNNISYFKCDSNRGVFISVKNVKKYVDQSRRKPMYSSG